MKDLIYFTRVSTQSVNSMSCRKSNEFLELNNLHKSHSETGYMVKVLKILVIYFPFIINRKYSSMNVFGVLRAC